MDYENATVIYTGPNLRTLGLNRWDVFRGGLQPYVKRAIEKIPDIEKLIVPVDELEETRKKIDKPGTNEARLFREIQKAARGIS